MNRWVAHALQGTARLAFWRKPGTVAAAQAPAGTQAATAEASRMRKPAGLSRFIAPLRQRAARLAFWRKSAAAAPNHPLPPAEAPASSLQPDAAIPITATAIDEPSNPAQFSPVQSSNEPEEEVFLSLDEPLTAAPGIDQLFGDDNNPGPVMEDVGGENQLFTDQTDPERVFADQGSPDPLFSDPFDPEQGMTDENGPGSAFTDEAAPEHAAPELEIMEQPEAAIPVAEQAAADTPDQPAPFAESMAAEAADTELASRKQRVLAMLSRKWVWIPSVSFVLLAAMGSLLLMLMQSRQEQHRLQTELLAVQKADKPSAVIQPAAVPTPPPLQVAAIEEAHPHAAEVAPATEAEPIVLAPEPEPVAHKPEPVHKAVARSASAPSGDHGIADAQPGIDPGDCVITDQASVIKNLKRCIDSFNTATAR